MVKEDHSLEAIPEDLAKYSQGHISNEGVRRQAELQEGKRAERQRVGV